MSQKQFLDKITRTDIQEAMRRFFEKGGKITKVDGLENKSLNDQFEVESPSEEVGFNDLNIGRVSLEQ